MSEKKGRRKGVGAQEREEEEEGEGGRESEEKTKRRKRKRKNEETDGRSRIASPDLEFNSHANHNEAAINTTRKSSQHFIATEMTISTILICNVHLLFSYHHSLSLLLPVRFAYPSHGHGHLRDQASS